MYTKITKNSNLSKRKYNDACSIRTHRYNYTALKQQQRQIFYKINIFYIAVSLPCGVAP
ncbi:unnamed protein product, partial [Ceratitis capitata]